MAKTPGLAPLPASLLRRNEQPESTEVEAVDPIGTEEQGGDTPSNKPARNARRTRRPVVASETKGRKLQLPDDIHDRLKLVAMQKRTTVSAVAVDILDRNLPRFRVEREG